MSIARITEISATSDKRRRQDAVSLHRSGDGDHDRGVQR
jgi:hypothetical protein